MVRKALAALLLVLGISAPVCAEFQPVTCKNSFTQQQEIQAGDKVAAEVYRQMPVLPDSDPIAQYIRQLGARLVAVAPLTPGLTQQWPFHFHVVASEDINAFALPGGTMFVNLGAIQAAETESQLVGVMGHEMSHVILRHSSCNISKQKKRSIWYSLGEIGTSIALGGVGGAAAAQGIGAAANLDFLRMSRTDEQQADLLGVRIAHDAGYDPRGLPQFFEIIQAKYGNGSAQFLSDHPSPGNRTEYVNKEIALLPPLLHPVKTSPQFEAIHQLALERHALTAGEIQTGAWRSTGLYATAPGLSAPPAPLPVSAQAPSAGAPEAAYAPNQTNQRTPLPKPSQAPPPANPPDPTAAQRLPADELAADSHLVTVSFPIGSIDAPATWRTSTQPDDSVAITPPRAPGTFGISYGVLIGTSSDKSSSIAALTVASDRLARHLLQTHGLKPSGIGSNLQVAGKPALAREFTGTSPISDAGSPLPEHAWLVTLPRSDGTTAYLLFVAPQADFATLQPLYDSMLLSFKSQ
jgi:hypothetical protein